MMYDRLLNDLLLMNIPEMQKNIWLNTEVFIVDNVADYIHHQIEKEELEITDFPNVAPCFPNMFFEYTNPRYSKSDGKIINFHDNLKHIGVHITSREVTENKLGIKWMSSAISFFELNVTIPRKYQLRPNSHFYCVEGMQYFITGEGEITPINENNYTYQLYVPWQKPQNGPFFIPWMALSFLHCKNVTMDNIKPSEKLNKSRVKKGKHPLVKYHILNITSIKKEVEIVKTKNNIGLKKALHICRGHFKDFSKGGGLFGKYRGLYWWESQVRGKISEGVTLKDYKLSTNQQLKE